MNLQIPTRFTLVAAMMTLSSCDGDERPSPAKKSPSPGDQVNVTTSLPSPVAQRQCPSLTLEALSRASSVHSPMEEARTILAQIDSIDLNWQIDEGRDVRKAIDYLAGVHQWVSKEPGYGNFLLSSACEWKLADALMVGLIGGKMAPREVHSLLSRVRSNRLNGDAVVQLLRTEMPDSPQAQAIAKSIQETKQTIFLQASERLVREKGGPVFGPADISELLKAPDAAYVFQQHAMTTNLLRLSDVVANYALAGGDLLMSKEDLARDLAKRVPSYFQEAVTNSETLTPLYLADGVERWRRKLESPK